MDVKLAQSDGDILRVFAVMRELRPHLTDPEKFLAQVRRQQAGVGWRLIYAEADGAP